MTEQKQDPKLEALDELAAAGELTAERLVKDAAAPDHPLHGDFTWDDSIAGHLYRLGEARRIISGCVRRVVDVGAVVESEEPATVKVKKIPRFLSKIETRSQGGGYVDATLQSVLYHALHDPAFSFSAVYNKLGVREAMSDRAVAAYEALVAVIEDDLRAADTG